MFKKFLINFLMLISISCFSQTENIDDLKNIDKIVSVTQTDGNSTFIRYNFKNGLLLNYSSFGNLLTLEISKEKKSISLNQENKTHVIPNLPKLVLYLGDDEDDNDYYTTYTFDTLNCEILGMDWWSENDTIFKLNFRNQINLIQNHFDSTLYIDVEYIYKNNKIFKIKSGDFIERTIFSYDKSNKIIKKDVFTKYSINSPSSTIYKYDKIGNLVLVHKSNTLDNEYEESYVYNQNNVLIKSIKNEMVHIGTDFKYKKTIIEFNSRGQKIKEQFYLDKELDYELKFSYSNNITNVKIIKDGKMVKISNLTYDKNNNIIKEEINSLVKNNTTINTFVYNELGQLVKKRETCKERRLDRIKKYSYDSNGNLIEKLIFYNPNETLYRKHFWKFDEHGNEIEFTLYNEKGELIDERIFIYEYDKYGNWIKKTIKDYNDYLIERKITYKNDKINSSKSE